MTLFVGSGVNGFLDLAQGSQFANKSEVQKCSKGTEEVQVSHKNRMGVTDIGKCILYLA